MALSSPFCNLTSFYFSIQPTEYARSLLEEEWGCFKHVGMSWDMIMRLPIQDRRALIRKHNAEQDEIAREAAGTGGSSGWQVGGEGINAYAELEQANARNQRGR